MHLSALKDFTDYFFSGLPDLQHPLDELITEGDKVAARQVRGHPHRRCDGREGAGRAGAGGSDVAG
jgi:predicted ester cyclase